MALKYDLTPGYSENPFIDFFVNSIVLTDTLLAYVYLVVSGVVLYYVYNRVQDDVGLSLLQSGASVLLFAILLFYMGIQVGVTIIHGVSVFFLVGLVSMGAGWLYYSRGDS